MFVSKGRFSLAALVVAGLLLAACQGGSAGADARGAADAIEAYLQARVESNVDRLSLLSCSDWEAQAQIEASTFEAMNAVLDGVSCNDAGTEGDLTLVSCQGKIVTTYQGETREWSVAEHPFLARQEGGEWRMCGYGE